MAQNLVIVESPAKAKTIQKYLGAGFEVLASYGHVRDLVPKEGAVDTDHGFAMKYELIERNEKHVKTIVAAVKQCQNLFLATDPDREGEAISWHLYEVLKEKKLLKDKTVGRVVFHEITKKAVQDAVAHPRQIADDLVNAQQARRALDYLVGFNLSPLLWRKVQPGLSAGRVQSPALRLICEREQEILSFEPREYWTLTAFCHHQHAFQAKLTYFSSKKVEQFSFPNEIAALSAQEQLAMAAAGRLTVKNIDKKQRKTNPAPPFTTSTLQQEANRKLGFSATRTMKAAQQLYEGIDIGGDTIGLITYMRTDSVTLSQEALTDIRATIVQHYGTAALPAEPRYFKAKSKNAQEAHEAVRPTAASRLPKQVAASLTPDQAKLYELIWKRTLACQMTQAVFDTVAVDMITDKAEVGVFRANGSVLVEAGFMAAYLSGKDQADDEDDEKRLPELSVGQTVSLQQVQPDQHFTEPKARYTEASLIKTLEEYDIGRPSTYASIVSTLISREYVRLEGKAFFPTDIGMVVNRFLSEHFAQYVDYGFTAGLEEELDAVSRGEQQWVPLLDKFWSSFKPRIDEKMELKRSDVSSGRSIGIDPASGKPVSARIGRFGPFVQIGSKEDEDKPRFASLKVNQRIDTLTLEDALALFALPRRVGLLPSGEAVDANIGRFGPYVKVGSQFVSLKKTDDPYTVTMERVQELIIEKAAALEAATVKRFGDTGIRIVKNRFGFSIMDDKRKVPLPKGKDPQTLSAFDCEAYLAEAEPVAKKAKSKATVKTASKGVAKAKAVKAESPLLPASGEVKAKRGRPSSKK